MWLDEGLASAGSSPGARAVHWDSSLPISAASRSAILLRFRLSTISAQGSQRQSFTSGSAATYALAGMEVLFPHQSHLPLPGNRYSNPRALLCCGLPPGPACNASLLGEAGRHNMLRSSDERILDIVAVCQSGAQGRGGDARGGRQPDERALPERHLGCAEKGGHPSAQVPALA